jgi:hypothetical protein
MSTMFAWSLALVSCHLRTRALRFMSEAEKRRNAGDKRYFARMALLCRAAMVLALSYVVCVGWYHVHAGTFYLRAFVPPLAFGTGIFTFLYVIEYNRALLLATREPHVARWMSRDEINTLKRKRAAYVFLGFATAVLLSAFALVGLLALLMLFTDAVPRELWRT